MQRGEPRGSEACSSQQSHVHWELINRCGFALPLIALAVEHGVGLREQFARHLGRTDRLRIVQLAWARAGARRRHGQCLGWRCRQRCSVRWLLLHRRLRRKADEGGLGAKYRRVGEHGLVKAVEHMLE
eukprot:scaffold76921_cov63-Phaeocystis_antarctica.AAC.4